MSTEKYKSISTNICHDHPSQYLAELLVINKHPEVVKLPYFWRSAKYQTSYKGFIINISKRLAAGAEPDILERVIKNYNITQIDAKFDILVMEEILK